MDLNILLHLIRHWWYAENLPHPSKRSIAECIGVSVSTVRRRIAAMENGGLILRTSRHGSDRGQQTNLYDLSGLIKAAIPYAEKAIEVRKQRQKEDTERQRQMSP